MKSLRNFNKDRVSGALLLLLGAAIVTQGVRYRTGTLIQMGAGFMPVVLGTLLALVGIAIFATAEARDFGTAESHPTEWRGWLCILGSVAAFVIIGTYGGLVPATFATVFIAAMGDRQNSVSTALLLAAGVTVAGVLIFIVGLKMVFPLFTWGH
jgi:Tripartite tricarboxylate transporter TctB family